MKRAINKKVEDYWMEFYVSSNGHCSLCGNHGVIDTSSVRTPVGVPCGRKNWCICPNGQRIRRAMGDRQPDHIINAEPETYPKPTAGNTGRGPGEDDVRPGVHRYQKVICAMCDNGYKPCEGICDD